VMHLKPAASAAGFGELKQELERLLGLALRPPRRPPPARRPGRDDAPGRPPA
jgi:hypothetical protein